MRAPGKAVRNVETERNSMPWNNQSGGGGGPWGGGGGPWGQGPRGPGGPQGSPPDLEDIIRRGQDRLKKALPGGAGAASPTVLGLIAAALVAFWVFQAVYTVQPDELAVELRFGKPKAELSEPGLHFHWWPIETVERTNIAEKLINIGEARGGTSSGLMLSGDQNIVDVKFSVAYQVTDPKANLFNVSAPDAMVRQVDESAMREAVGRRTAQDDLRADRQGRAARCSDSID